MMKMDSNVAYRDAFRTCFSGIAMFFNFTLLLPFFLYGVFHNHSHVMSVIVMTLFASVFLTVLAGLTSWLVVRDIARKAGEDRRAEHLCILADIGRKFLRYYNPVSLLVVAGLFVWERVLKPIGFLFSKMCGESEKL